MSTINVRKIMTDGKVIVIDHTYPSNCLEDQLEVVKKINLLIEASEKNEMPAQKKGTTFAEKLRQPEPEWVLYNRSCPKCKHRNCVTLIEDPHFPGIQKLKLYGSKCKRLWPYQVK